MKPPSKKRQAELVADIPKVQEIVDAAYALWGRDAVSRDPTRIWDLRVMWALKGLLPFGALRAANLGEVLWIAETHCGVDRIPWEPKTKGAK